MKIFRKASMLALFAALPFAGLLAASESYVQSLTGHLKKGDSLTVVDDKFLNLPIEQWNQLRHQSIDNIITFALRRDTSLAYQSRSFTCTLNITIKYFTSRDQDTPKEIDSVKLVLNYDTTKGRSFTDQVRYRFKNAFKVTVVINSISSPEWKEKLPDVFRLTNQIMVERKYPVGPDDTQGKIHLGEIRFPIAKDAVAASGPLAPSAPPLPIAISASDGQILLTWLPTDFPGAEEYDLEYTWIDGQSDVAASMISSYGGASGPWNIPEDVEEQWMLRDATRVTVTSPSYAVNLPYPDGYLLVRLRKAWYQDNGLRMTGSWVYGADGGGTAVVIVPFHQSTINWQYTGSFAEEGKKNEVITYFDASQRSRQSVTINNSDLYIHDDHITRTPTAVVQETVYDMTGRPAINVLPAPVKNSRLDYIPSFNRNSQTNAAYKNLDIALHTGSTGSCAITAPAMSTISGASQYYSPANSFLDADNLGLYYFNPYIPDAQGYPFYVTEYTPDNTGRIRRLGGVGPTLQTGMGHETNYYYGKPTASQLQRMFGMEVGDPSHYLKNMTIDPNGQASVSYVDASGKTIATALAGAAPPNLGALPSNTAAARTHFNDALIQPGDFKADAGSLSMSATATFLVETTDPLTLHYTVDPLALVTTYGGNHQLCNNCYYTLAVTVTNDCGQPVASATSKPFAGSDYTCHADATPITQDLALTQYIRPGELNVTYTLQLSNDVINAQTDYYVATNTDLKRLQDFFEQEVNSLDLAGCYNSCTACKALPKTVEEFTAKVQALLATPRFAGVTLDNTLQNWINTTYQTLKNNCAAISCAPASPCEQKLDQLKQDVLPGGQYALYDANALANGATTVFLETATNAMMHYNTDATISALTFVAADGSTQTVGNLSQADFVRAYLLHPEWADYFVQYHIEYCSYLWCKDASNSTPADNNEVSYTFDAGLQQNYADGADAVSAGYYNHGDPLALLGHDPWFNGGRGSAWLTNMQSDLQHLSTVLNIIMSDGTNTLPAKNIIQLVDWELYCKPTDPGTTSSQLASSWSSCAPADNCRSVTMEWQLYLKYYLQLKGKYYRIAKAAYFTANPGPGGNPACLDCFIGSDPLAVANPSLAACVTGNQNPPPPPPPPTCPSGSAFTLQQRDYPSGPSYTQNGCSFWNYTEWLVYSGTSLTNDVTVTVTGTVTVTDPDGNFLSAVSQNYPVTFHAGQTEAQVGSGFTFALGKPPTPNFAGCEQREWSFAVQDATSCPGGCPPANSFTTQLGAANTTGPDENHTTTTTQDLNYVYTGGAVSQPITVYCVQHSGGTNLVDDGGGNYSNQDYTNPDVPFTVTFPSGQSSVLIGTNTSSTTDVIVRDGNGALMDLGTTSTFTTYEVVSPFISCAPPPPPPTPLPPSTCTSDPNYAFYGGKNRVFDDYIDLQDYNSCQTSSLNTSGQAQAQQNYLQEALSELQDRKASWLSRLQAIRDAEFSDIAGSELSDATLNNVVNNLYQMSAAYLTYASQNGLAMNVVSSLPSAVAAPNGYSSFDQVFAALVPADARLRGFGADLLDNIYPYDRVPYTVDPNVVRLTPDIYDNVKNNLAAFQAAWNGQGSFGDYLRAQLGDDYLLTDAQLSDLQARLASGCPNPYLANPAILPLAFVLPNPGAGGPVTAYITCDRLTALEGNFAATYPNVPAGGQLYQLLFTNYLNRQLGYALSYADYAGFSCPSTAYLYAKPQSPSILEDQFSCTADALAGAYQRGGQDYDLYIAQVRATFRNSYISKCLSNGASANMEGTQYEYHYTLYYYDQSGLLVKTVPPEGVHLLSDADVAAVAELPAQDPASCAAFPSTVVTNQQIALSSLSAGLQNNTALSMEMWLFNAGGGTTRQVRMVTPDNNFMCQAAIAGGDVWFEVYSLSPDGSGGISMTLTNQAVAPLPAQLSLQTWTHLLVQSPNGIAGGTLQLYVDGNKLTNLPDANLPSYPFDWEVIGASGGFAMPATDIAQLQHLRLYNRLAKDDEVAADYRNSCLGPVGLLTGAPLQLWAVFNGPSFCNNVTANTTAVTTPDRGYLQVNSNPDPNGKLNMYALTSVVNTFTVEFWVNPQAGVLDNIDQSDPFTGVHATPPYVIFPMYGGSEASGHANMGVAVGTNGITVFEHAYNYIPVMLDWRGSVNGWTHVAVVYNNLVPSLYVGGKLVATGSQSVKTTVSPSYNFGGAQYGYMPGGLDEVRIWNVARTQAQLQASAQQSLSPTDQAGLVGYWPMDNTNGNIIHDISCGGNDAVFIAPADSWAAGGAPMTETQYVPFAGRFIVPNHGLPTNYVYNSLGQPVQQTTPDAGTSNYLYDRLGRLSVSQNAEQLQPAVVDANNPAGRFSYTRYDAIGRIVEVGEKLGAASLSETDVRTDATLQNWLASGSNRQVTVTAYDQKPAWAPGGVDVGFARKRVAATALLLTGSDPSVASARQAATYYKYDLDGNVSELMQENSQLAANEKQVVTGSSGLKDIKYEYDLISGKVNKVLYQDGKWDQFYYQYQYDADNRVVSAWSNRYNDPSLSLWTQEATYRYYLHGPLARMELGRNQVQGVDYAYTLQGWVKGVNGQRLVDPSTTAPVSMIPDGVQNTGANPFASVGMDAMAYSLGYFTNDYKPIGSGNASTPFAISYQGTTAAGQSLYNGNIGHATYALSNIETGSGSSLFMGYTYGYDQLNRLTAMDAHNVQSGSSSWGDGSLVPDYGERASFDGNGNILSYSRNGTTAGSRQLAMDNLAYNYNRDGHGYLLNNKLRHINDAVPAGNYPATTGDPRDLDDQSPDNYSYDRIGNIIGDNAENIGRINWTVYGKMVSIAKVGAQGMSYGYDAGGNRITKTATAADGTGVSTHYVRDAQGHVLAVYQYKTNAAGGLTEGDWTEQHLYGSSRLGMLEPHVSISAGQPLPGDAYNPTMDATVEQTGNRTYELTNHLGNVMTTVNDVTYGSNIANLGAVILPTVLSQQDYYPFGMQMPGRSYLLGSSLSYRYGFNGKENDNELKGIGNQIDYGMRVYDPRAGRFLSVDPISKNFPGLTPFQYASNRPTDGVDMDGLEYVTASIFTDKTQPVMMNPTVKYEYFTHMSAEQIQRVHGMSADDFYKEYSETFGPRGQGVLYKYFEKSWATGGKWREVGEGWTQMQGEPVRDITYHGIYSGPGGPLQYGPGPMVEQGKATKGNRYTFFIPPIDQPDAISRTHDIAYDEFTFNEYDGYKEDVRTLEADKQLLEATEGYVAAAIASNKSDYYGIPILGPGLILNHNPKPNANYKDPITHKPASVEAMNRALNMIQMFGEYLIPYKEWKLRKMQENGDDPFKNPKAMQDPRYQLDKWDDPRATILKNL